MLIKRQNIAKILLPALMLCACSPKLVPKDAPAVKTGSGIKVMSYNIHHANPPSKAKEGLIDVDAIANVINKEHPDLVGMQEVDNNTKRSGNINEAELIAKKTGMHYHFFKAIDHDGGDYGLAIFSKYPIEAGTKVDLPQVFKGEARILSYVTVKIPGKGKIVFANTHLDAQRPDSNRIVQVKRIMDEMAKQNSPIIITGDFNSEPNKETIKILDQNFKRSCVDGCAFTIPQINPNKTIDFIALKNADWTVAEHRVIPEEYASDHRPVVVTYQFK